MLSSFSLYQVNDPAMQEDVAHIFCAPDTLMMLELMLTRVFPYMPGQLAHEGHVC